MEQKASVVDASAVANSQATDIQATGDVPKAQPRRDTRRAILEQAFENERDDLLRIIEGYLRHPGINMTWQEKREMALDVYTELFIEAMRTLEKFDPNRAARPWLLGLANNVVLRKKQERSKEFQRLAQNVSVKREGEESDAEIFDRLTAASRHYHALESPLEKQAALDEILCNINEGEREVLMLSIVHGLQSDVVGNQLGISAPAARKRLQRALENLRADYSVRFSQPQNSATETIQ